MFVLVSVLHPIQKFFSHVEMFSWPWVEPVQGNEENMSLNISHGIFTLSLSSLVCKNLERAKISWHD